MKDYFSFLLVLRSQCAEEHADVSFELLLVTVLQLTAEVLLESVTGYQNETPPRPGSSSVGRRISTPEAASNGVKFHLFFLD